MLNLGSGTRQIKVGDNRTLYVFPDFADKAQFYYLPNDPHIASLEGGVPAISLLVYREDLTTHDEQTPDATAFLSLDVDLSWDPALIEQARSRLQLEDRLPDKPRLSPITFTKGSVKLLLLDAQTPSDDDAGPADGAAPSRFVTTIMGAASPSLYGSNRAIFQATLPKRGAAALSAALDGMTPIGVVYSLTFAGLQPAFNVDVNVDWQKVYDHFSEREELDALFLESDIQKSIDTLVENKAIQIDVTVEGIGAEAMDAEREAAMTAIRQLVFNQFFEATFKRVDAAGDALTDNAVDVIGQIAKTGFTLGVGYTYHRKEVKIEELRSLDIDWRARKAAERTIYPQAHMHRLLTGGGVTREQLIRIVDGADEQWKVLPLQVLSAAAWDDDGIAAITVDVEYDDPSSDQVHSLALVLDKEKDEVVQREWMNRRTGNRLRYKYEVVFQATAVPGPSLTLKSGPGWLEHEGHALVISPRSLYQLVELELALVADFPVERWPAVHASLRFRSDDGSFEHYDDAVLQANLRKLTTKFRIDQGMNGTREMQLTFIGKTGERIVQPWMPMDQEVFPIPDPRPDDLTVRAVVTGPRTNIANLIVNLEYSDEQAGIHESSVLTFDKETLSKVPSWTIYPADPSKRRYRYSMTLVTSEGDFVQTGWISSDAPTLAVGEAAARTLTVDVVTGELDPAVEAVDIALAYDDDTGGVHERQSYRLGAAGHGQWFVKLKDASQRSYHITTTWIRRNGFKSKVGPVMASDSYVVIPGAPPR